jgi:chorismate mutase
VVSPEFAQPSTPDAEQIASIADGRARIDAIDARLRDLIAVRRRISLDIQQRRMTDGGPRIEHRREHQVLTTWSDELGPASTDVARALLALCRGRVGR